MRFHDRSDAGRQLASRLLPLRDEDVVVLGLPRGGVPVAAEVARALSAPLDVILVRPPAGRTSWAARSGKRRRQGHQRGVVRYARVSEAEILRSSGGAFRARAADQEVPR
jgi:orotate phosphoribosyltransferase